jgi:DNA-binding NarL/FixJ family response regulator
METEGENTLPNIRVLIVDDHAILRDGIRSLLERQANIEVVGEASNGREAIFRVGELQPDIVLMDIAMPEMNGLDATRQITDKYPKVRILILTQHDNREFITPILQAGASGFILKKSGGRELVNAIHEVFEQGAFLEPTITRQLLDDFAQPEKKTASPDIHLTHRQKEVLNLLIAGKSNKEIAFSLSISPKTVSVHRSNIMKKLDVHNIFELLRAVSRYRLLDNTPPFDILDPTIQN